jgi:SNF2 family DNA or RNA helicase
MVEGNRGINNDLISRLHSIMRPFLLRRLKKDVEKQLPGKIEHIVMCKLSRRQQFLYEEFMSRSTTRSLLSGANYMGMMNILMQLRKVHDSRHVVCAVCVCVVLSLDMSLESVRQPVDRFCCGQYLLSPALHYFSLYLFTISLSISLSLSLSACLSLN